MKKKLLGFGQEFKKFAMRGNVIDLAIGVVIGAAFGKIVNGLVEFIIMPLLSPLMGKVSLSHYYLNLSHQQFATMDEALKAGAPIVRYGEFLNSILNFLIIALAIFFLVRQINKLKPKPEPDGPVPSSSKECPFCFQTIPVKATRCPHCTSTLTPGAIPSPGG